MAKVIQLHSYSGLKGLRLDTVPLIAPKENQIRIKVEAFSLNYGDFDLMDNNYVFSLNLPARIGDEAAGVIDAIGADVRGFKVGDKVSTLPWMNSGFGVNGEYAIVPQDFVTHYPEKLNSFEACSIWVAYLTAYFSLVEKAKMVADDFVLITAATSSAGIAAKEMAAMIGAKTIGTTRTSANKEFLYECGYDHVIVSNEENISNAVIDITEGVGARIVYDAVGGPMMQKYANGISKDAFIFLYGALDGRPTILPEIEFTQKAATLHFYSVYNHIYDKKQRERALQFIKDAINNNILKPAIDKVYPLEDFYEAYVYQKKAVGRKGKVVISC